MARRIHDHEDVLNCDCDRLMGHGAPTQTPREHDRQLTRRAARRQELVDRIPPGAIFGTGSGLVWTGVLVGGIVGGKPWVALAQVVSTLLLLAGVVMLGWRQHYAASPEAAESWFEREVRRIPRHIDVMDRLPKLELELDYRLGLKQRPEAEDERVPETLVPYEAVVETPPPRTRLVPVDGNSTADMARALLRAIPARPGKAWRSHHVHAVTRLMKQARGLNKASTLLALYEDEPELLLSDPGEVCRCGHYREVHAFWMPPKIDGTKDQHKCTGMVCECSDYARVPVIMLSSHGEPAAGNPEAPVVHAKIAGVLTISDVGGAYPPLPMEKGFS